MNKEDREQGAVRATERAKLRPALEPHDPSGNLSFYRISKMCLNSVQEIGRDTG